MTLGDAVAYALEHPGSLPNDRGEFRCQSCGRTFHQTHAGCPACDGDVTRPVIV